MTNAEALQRLAEIEADLRRVGNQFWHFTSQLTTEQGKSLYQLGEFDEVLREILTYSPYTDHSLNDE